jgi:hypothetical protein
MPVHIEEVWRAFQDYNRDAAQITAEHIRSPGTWAKEMVRARQRLIDFCINNQLPIDFTER